MATGENIFAMQIRYQVRTGPSSAQRLEVGPAALKSLSLAFERGGGAIREAGRWVAPYVLTVLEDFSKRQFRGHGLGPNRGKWAPLTDAYARWKAKHYPGKPILERTGALKESLTNAGDVNALREERPTGISYGSRIQYGHYHQLGTIYMVDRPLFDFDARFERKLRAGVLKGVRDALRDFGAEQTMADRIRGEDS